MTTRIGLSYTHLILDMSSIKNATSVECDMGGPSGMVEQISGRLLFLVTKRLKHIKMMNNPSLYSSVVERITRIMRDDEVLEYGKA